MQVFREAFPKDRITRVQCARGNRMLTQSPLPCSSISLQSTARSCSASQRSHAGAQSVLSFKTKFVVLIHSILWIFNCAGSLHSKQKKINRCTNLYLWGNLHSSVRLQAALLTPFPRVLLQLLSTPNKIRISLHRVFFYTWEWSPCNNGFKICGFLKYKRNVVWWLVFLTLCWFFFFFNCITRVGGRKAIYF